MLAQGVSWLRNLSTCGATKKVTSPMPWEVFVKTDFSQKGTWNCEDSLMKVML